MSVAAEQHLAACARLEREAAALLAGLPDQFEEACRIRALFLAVAATRAGWAGLYRQEAERAACEGERESVQTLEWADD